MSSHLSIFDPRIQLTFHGTCRLGDSPSHHLDESWLDRRVRFHLQQLIILDLGNLHAFGRTEFPERVKSKRSGTGDARQLGRKVSWND